MDIGMVVIIVSILVLLITEGFKKTGKSLLKIAGLIIGFYIIILIFGDTIKQMGLAIQVAVGILLAIGILYVIAVWKNPIDY